MSPQCPRRRTSRPDIWPRGTHCASELKAGGFFDGWDSLRLSTPGAAPTWTLIECYDAISGFNPKAHELSLAMRGQNILFFRVAGPAAHEPHYDVYLYRDGETVRRVLCHRTVPRGPNPEPCWKGIADGDITPNEDTMLHEGATVQTLLDRLTIDAILTRIGLSLDALFDPNPRELVLLAR